MVYLIRFFLIILIIVLLIRSFKGYRFIEKERDDDPGNDYRHRPDKKKISKDVGEFTDYEEVN
jgi:hypothetical protein